MTYDLLDARMAVDLKSTKKGEDKMTNTVMLRERISESGLKLQYIAEKLGISRYALSMKLDNRREFKTSEVATLCELLGICCLEEKEEIFFKSKVDL